MGCAQLNIDEMQAAIFEANKVRIIIALSVHLVRVLWDGFAASSLHLSTALTCRKAGKRVAAHAIGTQGIINALKAGVNTIEHGCCVDDEGIALFVRSICHNMIAIRSIAKL